jgi:DNA polymerase-3 subunit alpha
MAVLVENVQKRKTRKGNDFVLADFSDQSGQFSASCFEEGLVDSFVRWAKDGTCVLLNVELDSPGADEPPRVTVRGAKPMSEVTGDVRMLLTLNVDRIAAVQELALLLRPGAKACGEVVVRLQLEDGRDQVVRLGRDFELDGDFAERLSEVEGLSEISLTARRAGDHLRLVA